jgi:hypothetical protein
MRIRDGKNRIRDGKNSDPQHWPYQFRGNADASRNHTWDRLLQISISNPSTVKRTHTWVRLLQISSTLVPSVADPDPGSGKIFWVKSSRIL